MKVKIEEVTNDVDKEILEKYKISKTFFKKLLKEFENDRDVKEHFKTIDINFKRIFQMEIPDFKLNAPEEVTGDDYLEFLNLSYEKF